MRGLYDNISYLGKPKQCFIYIGTQIGYKTLKSFDLFNGWKTEDTVSRDTLEKILMEDKRE